MRNTYGRASGITIYLAIFVNLSESGDVSFSISRLRTICEKAEIM